MNLQVQHSIKIGSNRFSSTGQSRLLSLHCSSSLAIPVNSCRFVLAHPSDLSISPDDEIEIELGYENQLEKVFSGLVSEVSWQIGKVEVSALGKFQNLVASRINLSFEQPKAGDMVRAVCTELEVPIASVDDGIEFSAYVLGDHLLAYDHLRQLAQQCGFYLYANAKDQLVFKEQNALKSHAFQFGINILNLQMDSPRPVLTAVDVYGESPASHGEGTEGASWLTKKEVKGTSGSGTGWQLIDPTARTNENAAQIAEAFLEARRPKKQACLRSLGNTKISLTDKLQISGMPNTEQNGTYIITGVEHLINARHGFITKIKIIDN